MASRRREGTHLPEAEDGDVGGVPEVVHGEALAAVETRVRRLYLAFLLCPPPPAPPRPLRAARVQAEGGGAGVGAPEVEPVPQRAPDVCAP
eukprot:1712625-Rhodomonas_salina.1